jgi:hypothetical protein
MAIARSSAWTWPPPRTAPGGWPSLPSLIARGLSGVQLVVSDAHAGLVDAIGAIQDGSAAVITPVTTKNMTQQDHLRDTP